MLTNKRNILHVISKKKKKKKRTCNKNPLRKEVEELHFHTPDIHIQRSKVAHISTLIIRLVWILSMFVQAVLHFQQCVILPTRPM